MPSSATITAPFRDGQATHRAPQGCRPKVKSCFGLRAITRFGASPCGGVGAHVNLRAHRRSAKPVDSHAANSLPHGWTHAPTYPYGRAGCIRQRRALEGRRFRLGTNGRRWGSHKHVSEIAGYILAGGASSRMGLDKAGLSLGGASLVEHAARSISQVAASVSLVSAREGAQEFGLPVVRDHFTGLGALGGLHAALTDCSARWALVVACDLPFITAGLLKRLASFRDDGHDAVAPVQADGRPQPLCALYAARECAPAAARLIEEGELRPRVLLRRARTRWVAFDELRDLPGSSHFFRNVNTREEFAEARRIAGETF